MLGLVALIYGCTVVAYWLEHGATVASFGMALLVILFSVGFVDALITKLEMKDDAAVLRTLKGERIIPRGEIASVSWEAGVGVALKTADGEWVKLPYLGNSQGCTNTIRAWLKSAA